MLELDNLRFAYPEQARPYTFSMAALPGEVTAISGASGSGKSTLLDLIGGFLQPIDGRLALDGRNLLPLPPEKRPVSLLLQNDNLFDHISAAANISLGIGRGHARNTGTIEKALDQVGLSGLGSRIASELSGGQKQRVALARTLVRNRRVLLLDEPFSALDDETRRATRTLVRDMTRQMNWITILVSHHLDDIAALAQRQYDLADGTLAPLAVPID